MDKNKVLLAVAAVIFIGAGSYYFYASSPGSAEQADSTPPPADSTMKVKCQACGAEYEMSLAEYNSRLKHAGMGEMLVCDKCGQKKLWKAGGLAMGGLPNVRPEDAAQAVDFNKSQTSNQGSNSDQGGGAVPSKKAVAPLLAPGTKP